MFLLQKFPLPNSSPIGEKSNVSSSEPSLPTNDSTKPNPKEPESVNPPPATVLDEKNGTTKVVNTTEPISPPPANQTNSQDNGKLPAKMAPPPPNSGKNETEPDRGSTPLAKDTDKVNDTKGSSEFDSAETCAGNSKICRTENLLVACTLSIEKGIFAPLCCALFSIFCTIGFNFRSK